MDAPAARTGKNQPLIIQSVGLQDPDLRAWRPTRSVSIKPVRSNETSRSCHRFEHVVLTDNGTCVTPS